MTARQAPPRRRAAGQASRFATPVPRGAYAAVLGTAALCYAALGAVLRILPHYVPAKLGGGPLAVGVAVGAPAIGAIFARPLGGRWADRRGPLAVLLWGALAMTAASPLALVASLPMLLLSRLAVGAGEGVMMSAAALWLLRLGGRERVGRSMGHVGLANYAGLVLGPLLAMALAGEQQPARVFVASTALPAAAALLVVAARPRGGGARGAAESRRGARVPVREILAWSARPGLGLMCVNIGYAALISFGAAAIAANGARAAGLVVPVFAAGVLLVRGLAGGVPDRVGSARTLLVCCPAAAAGLCGTALLRPTALVVVSLVVLAAGQAFAVPALGALAVRRAPASAHGATAGLFFAWFDAGVGIGGPVAGLAAHLTNAAGALLTAAAAVTVTPLVAGAGLAAAPRRRKPQRTRSAGVARARSPRASRGG